MLAMILASPESRWLLDVLSKHEAQLLRFASAIVGPTDARDVVQDTFLELVRADRKQVEDHLVPWLFTVCKNRAISLKRGSKRRGEVEEVTEMASGEVGPDSALERKQAGAKVADLIATLPDRSREVVALKFAAGLSYKEIADVTGLTVNHVGVILHEALGKVRATLEKKERMLALATAGRQS